MLGAQPEAPFSNTLETASEAVFAGSRSPLSFVIADTLMCRHARVEPHEPHRVRLVELGDGLS